MPVQSRFFQLPDDVRICIFNYLDPASKFNILQSSKEFAETVNSARKLLLDFKLDINSENLKVLSNEGIISVIQFRNVFIKSFKNADKLRKFCQVVRIFKISIEIFEIEEFKRIPIKDFTDFFNGFINLRILKLHNCSISEEVNSQTINKLSCLEKIYFEKCDGNLFKLFRNQTSIVKITVQNDDWTWNGFSHDDFNDLVRTLVILDRITFKGIGCGSYFDMDFFPFKIRKLKTTLISFHWYVGIRTARVSFLQSQKDNLQSLTIEELPYDFDGGRVLKFIIEEMKLKTFKFGKTALILNGEKQEVKKISACEIQITSTYEMLTQFTTIKSFELILNQTDIDSGEVERVINAPTNLFSSVENLSVIDNSGYRRVLGVFLGLLKNLRNLKSIKLETQDQNINTLLAEFLPFMTQLESIEMDSRALRVEERFEIIRNLVPNLKYLKIASEFIPMAMEYFVEVSVEEFH